MILKLQKKKIRNIYVCSSTYIKILIFQSKYNKLGKDRLEKCTFIKITIILNQVCFPITAIFTNRLAKYRPRQLRSITACAVFCFLMIAAQLLAAKKDLADV